MQKFDQRKKAEGNIDIDRADPGKGQAPLAEPLLEVDRPMIMKFAGRHFDRHVKDTGRWNGRQIRNAFQIASSLAFSDMRKSWLERRRANPETKLEPPVLSHVQFIKVAQATLKFETYMNARGGDDQDLARIAHTRVDDRYLEEESAQQPILFQQRQRGRQEWEPRQEPLRFGAPLQTLGSNRQRSTFQEELSQYGNDNQENPYDDPYDMEYDHDPRDRRTPTTSERSAKNDLDYGFGGPNQGGTWDRNSEHRDQDQGYKEASQGYRDKGNRPGQSFGSLNSGSGSHQQGQGQGRYPACSSQYSTPGDPRHPKFRDSSAHDDY